MVDRIRDAFERLTQGGPFGKVSWKENMMFMGRDAETITATFATYVDAFQTLNPDAALPYCHVPCMFLSPQGVQVMATATEVHALFTRVMTGLKARGYTRSEITDLHVQQMSEDIAFLSVSRVRYKTDGQELERLGETYTVRKTADGWKIVVATMHAPQVSFRLVRALTPSPVVEGLPWVSEARSVGLPADHTGKCTKTLAGRDIIPESARSEGRKGAASVVNRP